MEKGFSIPFHLDALSSIFISNAQPTLILSPFLLLYVMGILLLSKKCDSEASLVIQDLLEYYFLEVSQNYYMVAHVDLEGRY